MSVPHYKYAKKISGIDTIPDKNTFFDTESEIYATAIRLYRILLNLLAEECCR